VISALPAEKWRPSVPGVLLSREGEVRRVTTPALSGAPAVETLPLTVARDGRYFFRLRYRVDVGAIALGIRSGDGLHWMAIEHFQERAGEEHWGTVSVPLKKGQTIALVVFNIHPGGNRPSTFTVERLTFHRDDASVWEEHGDSSSEVR
jgi:hypothetical protein